MIYVDTSALLRLIFPDETTAALDKFLDDDVRLVSSALTTVEARRGTMRRTPRRMPRIDALLREVETVAIDTAVLESAGRLPDPLLRPLDAIHLATALLIRGDIESVLTYDDRLAKAAAEHGLAVSAPGATPASP